MKQAVRVLFTLRHTAKQVYRYTSQYSNIFIYCNLVVTWWQWFLQMHVKIFFNL